MQILPGSRGYLEIHRFNSVSSDEKLAAFSRHHGKSFQIPAARPNARPPVSLEGCPVDMEHLADELRVHAFGVTGTVQDATGHISQLELDDPFQQQQAVPCVLQCSLQRLAAETPGAGDNAWFCDATGGVAATDALASGSYTSNLMHTLALLAVTLRSPVRVLVEHGSTRGQHQSLTIMPPTENQQAQPTTGHDNGLGCAPGGETHPTASDDSLSMPTTSMDTDEKPTCSTWGGLDGATAGSEGSEQGVSVKVEHGSRGDASAADVGDHGPDSKELMLVPEVGDPRVAVLLSLDGHLVARPPMQMLQLRVKECDGKWRVDVVSYTTCNTQLRKHGVRVGA